MVDRNLIREFQIDDSVLTQFEGLGELDTEREDQIYELPGSGGVDVNQIVQGVVLSVTDDEVLVDIGYKSEGMVPVDEWASDEPKPKPRCPRPSARR